MKWTKKEREIREHSHNYIRNFEPTWLKKARKKGYTGVTYYDAVEQGFVKPKNRFAKGVQKRFSSGKRVSDALRRKL